MKEIPQRAKILFQHNRAALCQYKTGKNKRKSRFRAIQNIAIKPNQESLKWKHWDFLISLKSLENRSHTSWSRGLGNYPRKKSGKSWSGAGFQTDTAERITMEVTAAFSFSHHVAKKGSANMDRTYSSILQEEDLEINQLKC